MAILLPAFIFRARISFYLLRHEFMTVFDRFLSVSGKTISKNDGRILDDRDTHLHTSHRWCVRTMRRARGHGISPVVFCVSTS